MAQEVLVEEAVAAVDALSREAVSALLGAALGSAPALVARGALDALGPLRGVVLPVPTPVEVLSRWVAREKALYRSVCRWHGKGSSPKGSFVMASTVHEACVASDMMQLEVSGLWVVDRAFA